MVKCRAGSSHFAMLLPVPRIPDVRRQVINEEGQHGGNQSLMTIEHLLYGCEDVRENFQRATKRKFGNFIEFKGSSSLKTSFAKNVVPNLDTIHFEPFRPIFDFVLAKIAP